MRPRSPSADLAASVAAATAGSAITLTATEVGTDNQDFAPWLRVRGPTGAQLGSNSGLTTVTLNLTAQTTGTYTVVVSSNDGGLDGSGNYELTLTLPGSP